MRIHVPKTVPVASAFLALLVGWATAARADVLYTQPYDGVSPGTIAQVFPDAPLNSTKSFDDFTVPASTVWTITGATLYGQEAGDPTQNLAVNLQFTSSPNFFDPSPTYVGSEDGSANLNFTLPSVTLTTGTYWITGWVIRPEVTGGQWFWNETDPNAVIGSEFFLHNPGGGEGFGTQPVPGSAVNGTPYDLSFTLFGTSAPTPEPSSLALVALGAVLGLAYVARAKHKSAAASAGQGE